MKPAEGPPDFCGPRGIAMGPAQSDEPRGPPVHRVAMVEPQLIYSGPSESEPNLIVGSDGHR